MLKKSKDPADYCPLDSSPEYRLSRFERLTLTGGQELEKALQWIAKQFASFQFADRLGEVNIDQIVSAARYYSSGRLADEPESFFIPPQQFPEVHETVVHGLSDGAVVDLEYKSCYQPQFPGYQREYEATPENNIVRVRLWRHDGDPRTTIVAIHGWTMGDQRINSLVFLPGLFYRLGFDVALIELPFHGRRRPHIEDEEELFPSTNVVRTNESMGQIISDLRELKLYLNEKGVKEVGVMGMSLGGYVAALWGSLDPLSFCVPLVPMVSMAEMAWSILRKDDEFEELKRRGLSAEMLKTIYRIHCPLSYEPKVPANRQLIIAGIGDEIVPPRQPKLLWDHWKRPQIQWFSGGHVLQFKKSQAFHEMVKFFYDLDLIEKPFFWE